MVLGLVHLPDLLRLFEDKLYRPRVINELSRRLKTTLALFVPDPEDFRNMMRREGAIIGGAVPLWFAMSQPVSWRPDHLDLLVSPGSLDAIREYLMAIPGSSIVDAKPYLWELKSQWRFRRFNFCVRTSRGVVRVVGADQSEPLSAVRFYWATHLMNVLTADAFVSPYFRMTMAGNALGLDARKVMNGSDNVGNDNFHGDGDGMLEDEEQEEDGGCGPFVDPRGFSVFETGAEFVKLRNGCRNWVGCRERVRSWTDAETILVQIGWGGGHDVFHAFRCPDWEWKLEVDPCANKMCFFSRHFGLSKQWVQALEAAVYEGVEEDW